jgi:hypothetical protein
MKDQQDTVSSVGGSNVVIGTNNPLPSGKIGGDQDMIADEHLDIAETALTAQLHGKRGVRSIGQSAYIFVPVRFDFDSVAVQRLNLSQIPMGRNLNSQVSIL